MEHAHRTLHGARVETSAGVHVARLHHVHGRSDHSGAEARSEGGHKVTRDVVPQQAPRQDGLLDAVVAHKFGSIDDTVASDVGQHALVESSNSLFSADGAVRLERVPVPARGSAGLCLHAHLDHVGGLGRGDGHRARSDRGQDADAQHGGRVAALVVAENGHAVGFFDAVVETYAHSGKAELPLEARTDASVQSGGSFLTSNGRHGAKDTTVLEARPAVSSRALALDLQPNLGDI